MNIFRFQHPDDLLSRLFILEYMREIGAPILYDKANKHQKEQLFYKFINEQEEDKEDVDLNWEYCLFEATLYQLEAFLSLFLDEIEEIDNKRKDFFKKAANLTTAEGKIVSDDTTMADINVMDLAATEIKKNNQGGFQLI